MKINYNIVIILLICITKSVLWAEDTSCLQEHSKEQLLVKCKLLEKEKKALEVKVKILKELLRKSELNKYNTIAYNNFNTWTVEEQIEKSSLILLKSLSSDGKRITTEVLKKGKDVWYDKSLEKSDESYRLEDLKRMGFQADLIFYGSNPPEMIFGLPVKDDRILYIPGEPMTVKKFSDLSKTYDGK